MDTITEYLNDDHHRCDDLGAEAKICVGKEQWDRASLSFERFSNALELHFTMEEDVLIDAFEKAIKSGDGPTCVMRNEHRVIRSIMFMLQDALERRAKNAFLGHFDTLDIMIQQHNLVEESFLYPMIDRMFAAQKETIINAMNLISAPECGEL